MDCQQSFLSLKSFPQFFFLRRFVKCSLEREEQLSNRPEKGAQSDAQTLPALSLQSMMVGGPSVKWLHSTAPFIFLSKHSHYPNRWLSSHCPGGNEASLRLLPLKYRPKSSKWRGGLLRHHVTMSAVESYSRELQTSIKSFKERVRDVVWRWNISIARVRPWVRPQPQNGAPDDLQMETDFLAC